MFSDLFKRIVNGVGEHPQKPKAMEEKGTAKLTARPYINRYKREQEDKRQEELMMFVNLVSRSKDNA